MARARRLPAPAGRKLARSVEHSPARLARKLVGAVPRQNLAARSSGADRSRRRAEGAGAVGPAARPRTAGADPYRSAERLTRPGRLFEPGRAHAVGAPSGDVRSPGHAAGRRRQGAAHPPSALAGAAAGTGDARPRELLGQRLSVGEGRIERSLPAPLLAGRSPGRRADRPRAAEAAMRACEAGGSFFTAAGTIWYGLGTRPSSPGICHPCPL